MPRIFKYSLWVVAWLALFGGPLLVKSATLSSELKPGDLIKGRPSTVYYFGSDGHRYVFPNEKTYFTWYSDFSQVKMVPDAELATIPLGATNITYRPGKKMVKIENDPKVYVVDRGGFLRHVVSEQFAQNLYGLNWQDLVEDVPVVFFSNYKEGPQVATSFDYHPENVLTLTYTIAQDKFLPENILTVSIGGEAVGFVPSTFTIKQGVRVVWINQDGKAHRIIGGEGWDSGILEPGQSFSRTFTGLGSFDYRDVQYRAVQGVVNVK